MTAEDMPQMRRATRPPMVSDSVPNSETAGKTLGRDARHAHPHTVPQATMVVAFVVVLLVLATTSQGAFAISRWAPLALFLLAALLGGLLVPGRRVLAASRPACLALIGIWGLALWSLLSMLWAASSGDAFQAADRTVLYAAIVSLPFALPLSRQALAAVGWSVAAGIGVIAAYVLIRLLGDGTSLLLAGRLNGPINYRNGTALLFALPVWPFIIAAATKVYRRPLRAGALALATLCLGLSFLTQSRGILIGLCVGGILVMAAGPDRVRRVWVAILVVGAVAAASPWLLRPYHAFSKGHYAAIPHDITVAGVALALVTIAAFLAGMVLALFDQGLRTGSPRMNHVHRVARVVLAGLVVVALIGAGAAIGNPVTFVQHKWDQFRQLNANTTSGSTRLLTVGGQRYDLWRVALKEFAGAPVGGVGADNYSFAYYRERKTNRNLTDPHSLLFSLLSETGIVGFGLFCLFVVGCVAALRRGWRALDPAGRRHALAPAAAGVVLLGQSMVDWIWLIPGLTAIGLFLLAVAAAQASGPSLDTIDASDADTHAGASTAGREQSRFHLTAPSRLLRLGAAAGLVAASLGVLALFMSDAYVQRARTVINNPRAELSAAQTAASLNPWAVVPHYLQASAYETMGNRRDAFRQLRDALKLEPSNVAILGLLGDFEARGRRFAAARAYYRRALSLDPLDTGLQQLARIGKAGGP